MSIHYITVYSCIYVLFRWPFSWLTTVAMVTSPRRTSPRHTVCSTRAAQTTSTLYHTHPFTSYTPWKTAPPRGRPRWTRSNRPQSTSRCPCVQTSHVFTLIHCDSTQHNNVRHRKGRWIIRKSKLADSDNTKSPCYFRCIVVAISGSILYTTDVISHEDRNRMTYFSADRTRMCIVVSHIFFLFARRLLRVAPDLRYLNILHNYPLTHVPRDIKFDTPARGAHTE